jgi:hypothetical protein
MIALDPSPGQLLRATRYLHVMSDLITRAYQTSQQWLALGHECIDVAGARLVRDRTTPRVYDANFAAAVRAESAREIDAVLDDIERVFAGLGHRHVVWDPGMPPPFEARLVLDDWRLQNDLVTLVLEGELRAPRSSASVRAAESDADWQAIYLRKLAAAPEPAAAPPR